eukprot:m.70479 g.70479  ORF g.70479 m.70479 type:complete len:387 (-) comp20086_c0_seq1:63-1223(-)
MLHTLFLACLCSSAFASRSYFGFGSRMPKAAAVRYCASFGGELAVITNPTENKLAAAACKRVAGSSNKCFIGLNDQANEGQYVWDSNVPKKYAPYAPGEPNNWKGNEDCSSIYHTGRYSYQWNDDSCTVPLPVICSIYIFASPQPMPQAMMVNYCRSKNAKPLAQIHRDFNEAAAAACKRVNAHKCWLTLNDIATEGKYEWGTGAPRGYRNYALGEPNNWGGNEDCTTIYSEGRYQGKWNDDSCKARFPALCAGGPVPEEVKVDLTPNQYTAYRSRIPQRYLRAFCKRYGAEPAKISNQEQNIAATKACSLFADRCWIGLNDVAQEGRWVWADRSPRTYENNAPGEPNNWGNDEDCTTLLAVGPYASHWNDDNCRKMYTPLCQKVN